MSGINFLSENLVDDAALSITTGAANAQFPLSNISNDSPSNKFRSTGNTVVIELDLATTRSIDSFSVVGDPTGTFNITSMTLKTSLTTDFSSSPVYTMDLSTAHNFGFVFITEVTHRFVEVTLTGSGSFAEVSNLFVGKRINLTQNNLSVATWRYQYSDKSDIRKNKFGQVFTNKRNLVKILSGTIEFCTKAEHALLDDMFIRHGRNKPLWMIVDALGDALPEGEFKLSSYGYVERYPQWTASGGQHYNAAIRIAGAV